MNDNALEQREQPLSNTVAALAGSLLAVVTAIVVGFGLTVRVSSESWFTFGLAVIVVLWIGGIVGITYRKLVARIDAGDDRNVIVIDDVTRTIIMRIEATDRANKKRQRDIEKEVIAQLINMKADIIRASKHDAPTRLRQV